MTGINDLVYVEVGQMKKSQQSIIASSLELQDNPVEYAQINLTLLSESAQPKVKQTDGT